MAKYNPCAESVPEPVQTNGELYWLRARRSGVADLVEELILEEPTCLEEPTPLEEPTLRNRPRHS